MDIHSLLQVRNLANQALVDVFTLLGGERWKSQEGWLVSGTDVKNWHGVTVEVGKLVSLNLISNDLEGEIPSSISNLGTLRELNLSYNYGIVGLLPLEIGNMSSLKVLHLYSAGIHGPIPESLSRLGNLEELWLNGNRLSGSIPAGLGRLPRLRELYLNANELVGSIPSSFRHLTCLEALDVSWNKLSGDFAPCLGFMVRLELLALEGNAKLEEKPPAKQGPGLLKWLAGKRRMFADGAEPGQDLYEETRAAARKDIGLSPIEEVSDAGTPSRAVGVEKLSGKREERQDAGRQGAGERRWSEEQAAPSSSIPPELEEGAQLSNQDTKQQARSLVKDFLDSGTLKPSLQEVLHDVAGPPFSLAELRAFARAQLMEENIDFLVEVERFKVMMTDEDSLQQAATSVCRRFVAPGAPMEVNLSGRVRAETMANMRHFQESKAQQPLPREGPREELASGEDQQQRARLRRNIFSQAQRQIFHLADTDAFPRFTQSVLAKLQGFTDGTLPYTAQGTKVILAYILGRIERQENPPSEPSVRSDALSFRSDPPSFRSGELDLSVKSDELCFSSSNSDLLLPT